MEATAKLRRRLLLAALLAIAAAALGCVWYFAYHTKTPEYALIMIREAAEQHDKGKFDRYVDVPRLADSAGDAFIEGMMDADHGLTEEMRSAVSNFAQMFKASISMSFQNAVYDYVRTGEWGTGQPSEGEPMVDYRFVLSKSGLAQVEFHNMEPMEKNSDDGSATVGLRVYQKEADDEFVFRARFTREADGVWRFHEISNFREFIEFVMRARRAKLQEYLRAVDEVVRVHEEKVGAADRKLVDILHGGSLGDMAVRRKMKSVMLEEIMPDWADRRTDLDALQPPASAQSLHHLLLRICDLRTAYAGRYSDWLETKEAAVIREANEILKEARTLEEEAAHLTRQMRKKNM